MSVISTAEYALPRRPHLSAPWRLCGEISPALVLPLRHAVVPRAEASHNVTLAQVLDLSKRARWRTSTGGLTEKEGRPKSNCCEWINGSSRFSECVKNGLDAGLKVRQPRG